MNNETEAAIIGAGPYGLSLAAHLAAQNVKFRIFGSPMSTWTHQMPEGMHLKSEGFASTLYDPGQKFSLGGFCRDRGIPYADIGVPVRLETFSAYGLAFQKAMVPQLEDKQVLGVDRTPSGFELHLSSGETARAGRVVVAAGITHFRHMPARLEGMPRECVSHSSAHHSLRHFAGKEVTVVGAGASAVDMAALLAEAGASVQLVSRKPVIHFHSQQKKLPRPLMDRLRAPMTGLGPGWRSFLCTSAPLLFQQMPEKFRVEVVRRHLGPSAGWMVQKTVVERVRQHLGCDIRQVRIEGERVHLHLENGDGKGKWIASDHIIAGTGYRVDLRRLGFLSPEIQATIRAVDSAPELSASFESSIEGLHFIGPAAAMEFGPLMRFAFGAGFASRRMSRVLASRSRRGRKVSMAARGSL